MAKKPYQPTLITAKLVAEAEEAAPPNKLLLSLAALGVVYGDIGTSPLYAFRECLAPERAGLSPTTDHVLSVLSLIFWTLTLVVVLKYLTVVLRADNHGEGGILALLALLLDREEEEGAEPTARSHLLPAVFVLLGIFGTCLLLADGMITPAISVLSAIEGLGVAAPDLSNLVVPVTVAILAGLFMVQRFGTARIASFFGPIMCLWFLTIALMGLPWIVRYPEVLAGVDPRHAIGLIVAEPVRALLLLGAIILCVTGAEALYADLGHFGRASIRMAWYAVAFPALLLNYFGQGAFVISRDGHIVETNARGVPETINLFYSMVDPVVLYPLLFLAALATIIASQALITGAYSLAEQAVQLGYLPRLTIVHTSHEMIGQIYVPFVNWTLMIACILLAVEFQESARLADAYGLAVIGTMLITTILVFRVTRVCWRWSLLPAGAVLLLFLAVDVPFLVANLSKVTTGGWVPLVIGGVLFTVMTTWRRGRMLIDDPANTQSFRFPLQYFVREIEETSPNRGTETVVFMTAVRDMVPMALLQMFERTKVLPGRLVLFHVKGVPVPRIADQDAIEIRDYGQNCFGVTARTGFLDETDVIRFLRICKHKGLDLDSELTFFYLSRLTLKVTKEPGLWGWRKALFAFMYQNARTAVSYYHLPADRVVELGRIVEL